MLYSIIFELRFPAIFLSSLRTESLPYYRSFVKTEFHGNKRNKTFSKILERYSLSNHVVCNEIDKK